MKLVIVKTLFISIILFFCFVNFCFCDEENKQENAVAVVKSDIEFTNKQLIMEAD